VDYDYLGRLGIIQQLLIAEFIDSTVLDQLSVADILKLRTAAWGEEKSTDHDLGKS